MPVPIDQITIVELVAAFWKHARSYYRKVDGRPTSSLAGHVSALRILKRLHGETKVRDFGAGSLKAVRQELLDSGLSRGVINNYVNLVRGVFKWGVAQELVPVEVHVALGTVAGLQRGRSKAKETKAVKPVPERYIEDIKPHISRQVWALIQLQRHTAARGGELAIMRAIDIDTKKRTWIYIPADHKLAYRGHRRTIFIGPKAQEIIRPFMADRAVDAYLFSPREAEADRHARAPTHRRPDQERNPRKTDRRVCECYGAGSYRRAIERGCQLAGVPVWTPHRLRHNAATFIRREYGIEAAQIMLGHAKADVTQIYAEINLDKGFKIAEEIG